MTFPCYCSLPFPLLLLLPPPLPRSANPFIFSFFPKNFFLPFSLWSSPLCPRPSYPPAAVHGPHATPRTHVHEGSTQKTSRHAGQWLGWVLPHPPWESTSLVASRIAHFHNFRRPPACASVSCHLPSTVLASSFRDHVGDSGYVAIAHIGLAATTHMCTVCCWSQTRRPVRPRNLLERQPSMSRTNGARENLPSPPCIRIPISAHRSRQHNP